LDADLDMGGRNPIRFVMSTRVWPSIGLVFLDDLRAFAPWISDCAPEWMRARGQHGSLLPPTVAPPPVLVVVARSLAWAQLELSAAWMGEAAAVVIVLDPTGDIEHDDEHEELRALEHEQLRRSLGTWVELIEARSTDDVAAAIERALARAHELADVHVGAWRAWDQLDTGDCTASAAGPWLTWSAPQWIRPPFALVDVIRELAPALCVPGGRPSLLDGVTGERMDLCDGMRVPIDGLAGVAMRWHPIAASPDGRSFLSFSGGRPSTWTLHGEQSHERGCSGGWGRPIGIDPSARVAWTGGRCLFDWRVLTARGPVPWTPSSHDWPCGHGKKLYGYEDNDPLLVQLAADAGACLSIYEHDTLLTPGLPLRWRDLGSFALAERARGGPRALLFTRADGDDGFPGDPYEADDEDARDSFATASLGSSPRARYVVGLGAPTYRLVDGVVTRLGSGHEWIVCDDQHCIVRREAGRMLAGWGQWVVVEHEGALWREHIEAGTRERICVVDRAIAGAVAVAGTSNVVLISLEPELALRLV
jgi:hypothetical protein